MTKGSYEVQKARLATALVADNMTYDQMVDVSGLKKTTIAAWITSLRTAGQVFIEGWAPDKNGRLFVPRWRWGNSPDAERPGDRRTPAERMAAVRARRRAEGAVS